MFFSSNELYFDSEVWIFSDFALIPYSKWRWTIVWGYYFFGWTVEGRLGGKKKKKALSVVLPLLILLKVIKLKLILIPILIGVHFIKKILVVGGLAFVSVLANLKYCKVPPTPTHPTAYSAWTTAAEAPIDFSGGTNRILSEETDVAISKHCPHIYMKLRCRIICHYSHRSRGGRLEPENRHGLRRSWNARLGCGWFTTEPLSRVLPSIEAAAISKRDVIHFQIGSTSTWEL